MNSDTPSPTSSLFKSKKLSDYRFDQNNDYPIKNISLPSVEEIILLNKSYTEILKNGTADLYYKKKISTAINFQIKNRIKFDSLLKISNDYIEKLTKKLIENQFTKEIEIRKKSTSFSQEKTKIEIDNNSKIELNQIYSNNQELNEIGICYNIFNQNKEEPQIEQHKVISRFSNKNLEIQNIILFNLAPVNFNEQHTFLSKRINYEIMTQKSEINKTTEIKSLTNSRILNKYTDLEIFKKSIQKSEEYKSPIIISKNVQHKIKPKLQSEISLENQTDKRNYVRKIFADLNKQKSNVSQRKKAINFNIFPNVPALIKKKKFKLAEPDNYSQFSKKSKEFNNLQIKAKQIFDNFRLKNSQKIEVQKEIQKTNKRPISNIPDLQNIIFKDKIIEKQNHLLEQKLIDLENHLKKLQNNSFQTSKKINGSDLPKITNKRLQVHFKTVPLSENINFTNEAFPIIIDNRISIKKYLTVLNPWKVFSGNSGEISNFN